MEYYLATWQKYVMKPLSRCVLYIILLFIVNCHMNALSLWSCSPAVSGNFTIFTRMVWMQHKCWASLEAAWTEAELQDIGWRDSPWPWAAPSMLVLGQPGPWVVPTSFLLSASFHPEVPIGAQSCKSFITMKPYARTSDNSSYQLYRRNVRELTKIIGWSNAVGYVGFSVS